MQTHRYTHAHKSKRARTNTTSTTTPPTKSVRTMKKAARSFNSLLSHLLVQLIAIKCGAHFTPASFQAQLEWRACDWACDREKERDRDIEGPILWFDSVMSSFTIIIGSFCYIVLNSAWIESDEIKSNHDQMVWTLFAPSLLLSSSAERPSTKCWLLSGQKKNTICKY